MLTLSQLDYFCKIQLGEGRGLVAFKNGDKSTSDKCKKCKVLASVAFCFWRGYGSLPIAAPGSKVEKSAALRVEWDSFCVQCPVKFQNRERGIEFCGSRKIIRLVFIWVRLG